MKFTAEPIPVPPVCGTFTSTDRVSLLVITIGYVDSKNVVSFGLRSILKNLFAVTPYPRALAFAVFGLMNS